MMFEALDNRLMPRTSVKFVGSLASPSSPPSGSRARSRRRAGGDHPHAPARQVERRIQGAARYRHADRRPGSRDDQRRDVDRAGRALRRAARSRAEAGRRRAPPRRQREPRDGDRDEPSDANMKMTPAQQEMMHKTMQSKAAVGASMMMLPDAATMEYTLTKRMNAPEGSAPQTMLIPLNDKLTVTAQRTDVSKTDDGYIWRGVIDGSGEPVTLLWWPSGRLAGTVVHGGTRTSSRTSTATCTACSSTRPTRCRPTTAPPARTMMAEDGHAHRSAGARGRRRHDAARDSAAPPMRPAPARRRAQGRHHQRSSSPTPRRRRATTPTSSRI